MSTAGRAAFQIATEISPILLTRGIATNIPGGVLPIVALTDAASVVSAALTTNPLGGIPNFDSFFAHWYVLAGGTLVNQQVATYPFANQAVAANAVIAAPNTISMMMIAPAKPSSGLVSAVGGAIAGAGTALLSGQGIALGAAGGAAIAGLGGYPAKLAIMTALQKTITQHNALGGTYSVVTPAYIYTDCIMGTPGIRDVSSEGQTQQKQYMWQWDFIQPQVVTQAQAANALNSLMQKLSQGLPLSGPSQVLGNAGLPAGGVLSGIFSPTQGAVASGLSLVPK
jgi:hypothetical protein